VAIVAVAITVAFLVLAVAYIWLGDWRSGARELQPAL
jgi:hypothetical protein